MAKQKSEKSEKVSFQEDRPTEFDGSVLPPVLHGPSNARPFRPDMNRTIYYESDTGNVSMYIDNAWIHIEQRQKSEE